MPKDYHAWHYPPDGGPGRIFTSEADVPPGWRDAPASAESPPVPPEITEAERVESAAAFLRGKGWSLTEPAAGNTDPNTGTNVQVTATSGPTGRRLSLP